ncbi:MAG TPA: tyrosine-type recombinase/integrase [Patescibacteria group bacterium]|nr:tyrosine-type recombinase/integrase [Patescibacteria group bacterium]
MPQALSTPAIVTQGDLGGNAASWARHLRASNLAPRTQQTYGEAVAGFARFLEASGMPTDIANIRREHVETWIEKLLAESKPATATNRYRSLQQFFRWAVEEGEITTSPMAKMRPPKVPDVPPAVLTDDELRRLLATCAGTTFEDRRDQAIIRTFAGTGARLSEVTGLRWTPKDPETNDVDLDAATIHVLGKGRRPRVAHMGAKAAKAIDRYLRLRARHAHADSTSLWIGERGPLTVSGMAQLVRRRGDQAGLAGLHPHAFRHAYASAALTGGMNEGDLMQLAGWRSRSMLDRYGRAVAADRAIAASRKLNPGDRL